MREKSGLLLMTVRLRVQLGRITEIETSYFRAGGGGPNNMAAMDNLKQPKRSGSSQFRQRSARLVSSSSRSPTRMALTPRTPRVRPPQHLAALTTWAPAARSSSRADIYRRFPLMDEERGVVWSNCVFDMDGTVAQIKLNTGEMADMSSFAVRASSIHVTEAFRIENNLIRRVEMIGTGVPYHFNSSWGPVLSGK